MISFEDVLTKDDIYQVVAQMRPVWHRAFVLGIAAIEIAILAFMVPPFLLLLETLGALAEHGSFWESPVVQEHLSNPQFIIGGLFVVFVGLPILGFLIWSTFSHIGDAFHHRRTARQAIKRTDGLDELQTYTFADQDVTIAPASKAEEVHRYSDHTGFRFVGDVLCLQFRERKRGMSVIPVPAEYRKDVEGLIATRLEAL